MPLSAFFMVNENCEPLPDSLATETVPPCSYTICFTMIVIGVRSSRETLATKSRRM